MDHLSVNRRVLPNRLAITGLLLLAAIPVIAGGVRIFDVTFVSEITAENARFHAAPLPILLHIIGASLFLVLGAFQFVPGLRRFRWHRIAGRIALVAGLVAAFSGLWMTSTYPKEPNNPDMLYGFRMTFGTFWAVALGFAFHAVRLRDFAAHRAWMIRAYAVAAGAGTTVLTFGLWYLVTGLDNPQVNALAQAAAWAINLTIAEMVIRRTAPKGLPA